MNKINLHNLSKGWGGLFRGPKHKYSDLINHILSKYNIDDITLNVYEDNKVVNMFSTDDITLNAILICNDNLDNKYFTLYIRKGSADPYVIAHEVEHLRQYHSGDLRKVSDSVFLWKGKEIDGKEVKYMRRPWEVEAFDTQKRNVRSFIKSQSKENQ